MDGYPVGSLDHNVPFLVVSGLTSSPAKELSIGTALSEQGILLRSEIDALNTKEAKALEQYFRAIDDRELAWHGQDVGKTYKLRVATTGRVSPEPDNTFIILVVRKDLTP
jgi:trafficking protein particle complex subunit 11